MDIEKINKIVANLPTMFLLRHEYGCGGNNHGCTQPIIIKNYIWENIDNTDFDGVDENGIYLSWLCQNEFYIHEPDECIGYLKCYTVYDLLDCCGDWLSGIRPEDDELERENGLDIVRNNDGSIAEWQVTDPSKYLDYILKHWDFSDLQTGYEDDVRTFLIQKWLR